MEYFAQFPRRTWKQLEQCHKVLVTLPVRKKTTKLKDNQKKETRNSFQCVKLKSCDGPIFEDESE